MKYLAIIAAALIASASAFCPNLCSGHGRCGTQDRCTCYTYAGTTRGDNGAFYDIDSQQAAWTGADCSLRTCPRAYSFGSTPNGLSTKLAAGTGSAVGSYVVALTAASDPSAYKSFAAGQKVRITDGTTSELLTIKSGSTWAANVLTIKTKEDGTLHGSFTFAYIEPLEDDVTQVAQGLQSYVALSGDYGNGDANGAHAFAECAGQGICDRTTGQCNCFPGYEGEACARTSCPNGCSGHGTCLEQYRIAADFGETYDKAWDSRKHFGCKCDVGFRGADCSLQECPSDFDPLNGCGGGVCNTGGTYTAKGASSTTNCPNSSGVAFTNYLNQYISVGKSDCSSNEQRDCSGRGICDYSSGTCKCFSGFFGESCNVQTILV